MHGLETIKYLNSPERLKKSREKKEKQGLFFKIKETLNVYIKELRRR